MLSSIGRASVRRVVARGPQSTNRALQSVRQFQRADNLQNTYNASTQSQTSFSLHRSYVTATKVVAKPKASKTTATKPKTKTKTKTVTKKVVKKAVKKPVKKPVKKKRAVAKKPVKKPVKRVRAPGVLAKLEATKKAANVKALKDIALTNPKLKPITAWTVLASEVSKAATGATGTPNSFPVASAKYKSLSPAELESYNHIAAQNRAENEAAYKKWVASHTPDEIRHANNARRALRLLSEKGGHIRHFKHIEDDRVPKRPTSARLFYHKDRWASGDFKGIRVPDASKLMMKEWEALAAADRQVYEDRQAADKERYAKEFKAAFGRDPEPSKAT